MTAKEYIKQLNEENEEAFKRIEKLIEERNKKKRKKVVGTFELIETGQPVTVYADKDGLLTI